MKESRQTPYQSWLAALSPSARKALGGAGGGGPTDDESEEYALWRNGLSDRAREAVDGLVRQQDLPEDDADPHAVRYGLVETESGEFSTMRLFKTAEHMARYIGKLDGKDFVVWPFFGLPLLFSAGPQRYLQMPDQATVMAIPRDGVGPCHLVEVELVDFEPQEDGFLGPPELATTTLVTDRLAAMAQEGAEDDDDEDDEGDDDGQGADVPVE